MENLVNYTPEMRDRLRKAYLKAEMEEKLSFTFDGKEYVTLYAKYLLEYLDAWFKINNWMDKNKKAKT